MNSSRPASTAPGPPAGLSGLLVDGVASRRKRDRLRRQRRSRRRRRQHGRHQHRPRPARRRRAGATKSLSAPTPLGSGAYFGEDRSTVGLSSDLTQSVLWSNQPLAGAASPAGTNLYLRRADGSMVALTKAGAPKFSAGGELSGASLDFSRLFIVSTVKQVANDPVNGGNTYEWANGNLKLVTLPPRRDAGARRRLPARGRPAGGLRRRHSGPLQGGRPPRSLPARQRPGNQERLRLGSAPSRTPRPPRRSVGIAADGSQALFTSHSELTEDANTGTTSGVPNDQGADLYSYDVGSGELTDLTVDANPADVGAGADVEGVLGASRNADYVYFIATGNLAPGATSGAAKPLRRARRRDRLRRHRPDRRPGGLSLLRHPRRSPRRLHVGRRADRLRQRRQDRGLQVQPTAAASSALRAARAGNRRPATPRSPAGRSPTTAARLFFQSTDAVLPQAQSALSNVFEYAGGETFLLTPGTAPRPSSPAPAPPATTSSSPPSKLWPPKGQGPVFGIYDARVDADVPPVQARTECQGEGCRGAPTLPPQIASPGSAKFEAPGTITAPKSKLIRGAKTTLRLALPERGNLSVVGRGLKPVKEDRLWDWSRSPSPSARAPTKGDRGRASSKPTPKSSSHPPSGALSRAETALKFISAAKGRGGK